MKIIKQVLVYTLLALFCYVAFLANLQYKILSSTKLENYDKKNFTLEDSTNFSYETIDYYLTPTTVGFKIIGLKQSKSTEESNYKDPVYVGINFFTFNFFVEYNGYIESKKDSKNYIIQAKTKYNFNTDINIINANKAFENFPNLISHLKIINADFDKISIFAQEKKLVDVISTNFSIIPKENFVLDKDIKTTIKNILKSCTINAIIDIENLGSNEILPKTIFTSLIPDFSINGSVFIDVDAQNTDKLDKIYDNSKIRIICDNCKSEFMDFSGAIVLDTKSDEKSVKIDASFSLKEKLSDFIHKKLSKLKFSRSMISLFVKEDFSSLLKANLPKINPEDIFEIKCDSSYFVNNSKIQLNIENFSFKVKNGSYIAFKGKSSLQNFLEPKIDIELLVSRPNSILTYWMDYYYNILHSGSNYSKDYIEFNKDVNLLFLKKISLYPDNQSDNFLINLNFNNQKLVVSNNSLESIKEKYFLSKTEILRKNINSKKNPDKYIELVAPEAKNYINNLKQEESKISEELWQRLIR